MTLTVHRGLSLDESAQAQLFRRARTAREFAPIPVPPTVVSDIYDLVRFGPTSLNSQPLRILTLASDTARQRLLPHVSSGNRDKTASAPLVVVLAADTAFADRLPEVFPHKPFAKSWFADEACRRDTAEFNAAIQIGYFIVGVRAAGLAAGPMAGFDRSGVDGEFFATGERQSWRSLLVVNIGYPAGYPDDPEWTERLPRLPYPEVVATV